MRTRESGAWYVVPGVAYLLSSFAALLVFCDGIYQIRHSSRDLTWHYLTWFGQMLLAAGFFSLLYLALLKYYSGRYRASRRSEVILSAACGVASAFVFGISLRISLNLLNRGVIPGIIIAVVIVLLAELFVLESLRRRRDENGSTKTRRTAALLSPAYSVSCFVFLIVLHLPVWPSLHLDPDAWNPDYHWNAPLFLINYEAMLRFVFNWSTIALGLWLLHVLVLTSLFPRWRDIPQRWFVVGSSAAGLLTVVVLEVVHLTHVARLLDGVDNIAMRWVTGLLYAATLFLLPTIVVFEILARRRKQRVLATID